MSVYQPLTLGELIERLEALGDATVYTLDTQIHSYRGYYDRPAIEPTRATYLASELAKSYKEQIGQIRHGWKGGEYPISDSQPVYYAVEGSTGPNIVALEPDREGVYLPVLVNTDIWW